MTVEQLIAQLTQLHPKAEVYWADFNFGGVHSSVEVEQLQIEPDPMNVECRALLFNPPLQRDINEYHD
jgi:hypothetical protein